MTRDQIADIRAGGGTAMSGDAVLAAEIAREIADLLEPRIDNAWHERSIWNYRAAQDAEKELGRFCAAHKDAILAALRRPEPAADVVEAVAMAIYEELWKGRANWEGISGLEREQCSALGRAALAAMPRPEADEGAVPSPSEYRSLLDACWVINDRLRITPGMEAIFTGSTNDIDAFRDLLHELEPAYRSAALAAAQEPTPSRAERGEGHG